MTQVLLYDYGKSRVTLPEIRAAIKAVKSSKAAKAGSGVKIETKGTWKAGADRSRKGA
jgi:hypothetical protein